MFQYLDGAQGSASRIFREIIMVRKYILGNHVVFDALKRQIISDSLIINVGGREAVILQFLYENVNKVLSKEDIQDKAWGNVFVSETSLTKAISNLRKSLAQFDGLTCEIKTISKEGYLLILEESIINTFIEEEPPIFDVKKIMNSDKMKNSSYGIYPSSIEMVETKLSYMSIHLILICFSSALLSSMLVAGVVVFFTKVF